MFLFTLHDREIIALSHKLATKIFLSTAIGGSTSCLLRSGLDVTFRTRFFFSAPPSYAVVSSLLNENTFLDIRNVDKPRRLVS